MMPFVDLTPAVRQELNQRRREPLLIAAWLGFASGCALTVIVFAIIALCAR